MNVLASLEGTVILLLFAAGGAILQWISKRAANSKPPPVQGGSAVPDAAQQEKMRRFMDALGMPAGEAPVSPFPVPRRAVNPRTRRVPEAPRPRMEMPSPPPLPKPRSLDEAVLTKTPAGRIVLPPLEVPQVPEIYTTSSRISAIPGELADTVVTGRAMDPVKAALYALLRSPDTLRSAVILRDVLGPPRGLQSFREPGTLRVS